MNECAGERECAKTDRGEKRLSLGKSKREPARSFQRRDSPTKAEVLLLNLVHDRLFPPPLDRSRVAK